MTKSSGNNKQLEQVILMRLQQQQSLPINKMLVKQLELTEYIQGS
jgi:hypothetical protein